MPPDCYDEVFDAIPAGSRPHSGEWILIYGGEYKSQVHTLRNGGAVLTYCAASSVTAQLCIQLAKSVGLKVIGVVDVQKHGKRLTDLGVGKPPLTVPVTLR